MAIASFIACSYVTSSISTFRVHREKGYEIPAMREAGMHAERWHALFAGKMPDLPSKASLHSAACELGKSLASEM